MTVRGSRSLRSATRRLRCQQTAVALFAAVLAMVLASTAPAAWADTPGAAPRSVTANMALGSDVRAPLSPGQLFGDDFFLIPGGTETSSFVVRNASSDPAFLSIALSRAAAADSTLLEVLTVKASPRGSSLSGPGTALIHASQCPVLVQAIPLAAGAQVSIDVSLSLAASVTGLQHIAETGSFNFVANLQQAIPGSSPVGVRCDGTATATPTLDNGLPLYALGARTSARNAHASLASTGINILMILIVASALLGGGASLIVWARRRRSDDDVPYDSRQPRETP